MLSSSSIESAWLPPPPASPKGSESEGIGGRMMEKRSIEFVVEKYSSLQRFEIGKSINSSGFSVGGHLFTLEFYPNGCNSEAFAAGEVSILIKHESEIGVDVVFDLLILDQCAGRGLDLGYSCFNHRPFFKEVAWAGGGKRFGYVKFWSKSRIHSAGYVDKGDSLTIRADLGVFVDAEVQGRLDHEAVASDLAEVGPPLALGRCLLFQVGYRRYYAEEFVIRERSPALLSHSHIPISDPDEVDNEVDNEVFQAMLWFIYNQLLHEKDKEAMVCSDAFARKILAAADRFQMKDLRAQCQSYLSYGEVAQVYYSIEYDFKTLRTYGCWLWAKAKEALSVNIKDS